MTQAHASHLESTGMIGRHPRVGSRLTGFQRLVALVAVLGVCMMPVEYRGGAQMSHAHALFQFLFDAAHGSLDHHGHTFRALPDRAVAPRSHQRAMMVDASRAEPAVLHSPPPPIGQPLAMISIVVAALALGTVRRILATTASTRLVGFSARPPTPPPRLGTVAI